MISISSKSKIVVTTLLFLSLTTLASEQKEEEYDQEIGLPVMLRDEEDISNEENTSNQNDRSNEDGNFLIIDETQEANQSSSPCHKFLMASLIISSVVDLTYFCVAVIFVDPLLICHSISLFVAFIRTITCLENSTNAKLIQLGVITCITIVLGCLGKDKILSKQKQAKSELQLYL